jgi:hypothetical protein
LNGLSAKKTTSCLISDIGFIRAIPDAVTPSAELEGLERRIISVVSLQYAGRPDIVG